MKFLKKAIIAGLVLVSLPALAQSVSGGGDSALVTAINNVIAAIQAAAISVNPILTYSSSAFTNTKVAIKATPGSIDTIDVYNPDAGGNAAYIQCFDLATGSVTLGTTPPKLSYYVPAGGGRYVKIGNGFDNNSFSTAITCAGTTTYGGLTAPVTNLVLNFTYR